ncbi:uncharacterized protein A1O5_11477 [Cladophialophora psammophila CBS 110553]|uniref:Uncharacterized protein n=1 Tax=Cladophialophora psammophila CBS 110553 TaxID=1182543 RepID=W9W650_9EURO|nr:uncharacterized protein A1O5_11477 [Cladophialophora psammophila CBS 110553]EXJ63428.1 hypothetical protein A1O5_11477 [Cladophialophora psammophila CBS 110553]
MATPQQNPARQPAPACARSASAPQRQPLRQITIEPLNIQTASPKPNALPPPTLLKHRLRRFISQWNNWWILEIAAGMLNIVCLIIIIILLDHFDGKPLSRWHSRITPNAMISVLATVSKSSVLLPVAECISQLTWLQFQRPHSLQLIQEFDEASRGALGSFQILFSTEAIAAWFGATITLMALAFEPFVQQVLLLQTRQVLLNITNTQVPVSSTFNTGKTFPASFPVNYYPLGDEAHALDSSIRAAGFNGIYNGAIEPPYECGSSSCRFGSFASLGICSSCTNVSDDLKDNCTTTIGGRCESWEYTTPANISVRARYDSGQFSRNNFATLFNSSATKWNELSMPSLAQFSTIKFILTTDSSGLDTLVPILAHDCSLRLCIRTWAGATFENSTFTMEPPEEINFQRVMASGPFSILELDPTVNATRFGTYKINTYDWQMMASFLAATFSYQGSDVLSDTDNQGVPIMLYYARDLPAMIQNLANSLTNMIRTSPDSTLVAGEAFRSEAFIKIHWPWISLPAIVVFSSNSLLVIMMIQSHRKRSPIWKSSVLALLFHGLKPGTTNTADEHVTSLWDMELLAERKKVRLDGSTPEELIFVPS